MSDVATPVVAETVPAVVTAMALDVEKVVAAPLETLDQQLVRQSEYFHHHTLYSHSTTQNERRERSRKIFTLA